tara:strand:+ start:709 stop:894 length:186 start_codon:yes stop_codon:yes gene_type:complete
MKPIQKKNSLIDNYILLTLFLLILLFQSIKTLLELFSYGIIKKEVLTEKSNLGFDLKIRMK